MKIARTVIYIITLVVSSTLLSGCGFIKNKAIKELESKLAISEQKREKLQQENELLKKQLLTMGEKDKGNLKKLFR